MIIQPINSIECALLHNRFSPMAESQLVKYVEAQAKIAGCDGECHHAPNGNGISVFNVGEYQISISQIEKALPKQGFGGCLPQPITILLMPDAERRVDRHVAHTFISISRQVPTVSAELKLDIATADPLDFHVSDDSRRAMKLAYLLADGLHRNNPATAIHWLPSDHLVSPQLFEQAALETTLTSFFVRPYLFSSAGAIGKGKPVGMVANGSQYLLGKPVIFEEAFVDYQWMVKRVCQFIDRCLREGAVPAHGTSFQLDQGEIIEVVHKDPEAVNPMGSFTLVVRSLPITKEKANSSVDASKPKNSASEPDVAELDENDPIDLAILNALRARKTSPVEETTRLPEVKDRRMQPRKTHEVASFGRRAAFGRR